MDNVSPTYSRMFYCSDVDYLDVPLPAAAQFDEPTGRSALLVSRTFRRIDIHTVMHPYSIEMTCHIELLVSTHS